MIGCYRFTRGITYNQSQISDWLIVKLIKSYFYGQNSSTKLKKVRIQCLFLKEKVIRDKIMHLQACHLFIFCSSPLSEPLFVCEKSCHSVQHALNHSICCIQTSYELDFRENENAVTVEIGYCRIPVPQLLCISRYLQIFLSGILFTIGSSTVSRKGRNYLLPLN